MKNSVGALVLMAVVGSALPAQVQRRTPPTPPVPPAQRPKIDQDLQVELDKLKDLQMKLEIDRMKDIRIDFDPELLRLQARDMQIAAQQAEQAATALHGINWGEMQLFGQNQTVNCSAQPGPRFPHDAADSLYSQARNLVNAGDYRAAVIRLTQLQQRYPNSRCIAPGMYYHAFSLYRIGADSDLREALAILESHRTKFPNHRMSGEVTALATRIRGRLADRGDATAQAQLRTANGGGARCDPEDQAVRSEALRGLMRFDPEAAMPKLREILEQQDACWQLRQTALSILGSRRDPASFNALVTAARSDSVTELRSIAAQYVAQYETDAAASALEAIARNDQSAQVRRSAARSLVGHPAPRSRTAARALLSDTSVADNIRIDMLSRFNGERATADDATWLKSMLPREQSTRMKSAIIGAVQRIGRTEDQQWLMDLATNDAEPATMRAEAFRAVSRSLTVAQLSQAFDNAGSTTTREQILRALDARSEPAAGDKMLEVVRRSTDPRVRALAIELLSRKKDPRLTAALLELIDR